MWRVPPIVTFTSDFGLTDWFVGVVHGVVQGICPDARMVDLCHAIAPGHVESAAFLLEAAAHDFPPGTIHLAVVDPGVGTGRLALAVSARKQLFVGPDNGLLEWALADPQACAHALTEERWMRHPVSRTFHGRDVFAPAAAHLACGVPIESFGPRVPRPRRLPRAAPVRSDGSVVGQVAYVDRFGNALTNLTAETLDRAFAGVADPDLVVEVVGRRIHGVARSYGDSGIGTLLALVGSSGRLEIAEAGGDAAQRFGIGLGDAVLVHRR
jgi:S-adenosyl-L-methionine hydrolase (adenosine-forming)